MEDRALPKGGELAVRDAWTGGNVVFSLFRRPASQRNRPPRGRRSNDPLGLCPDLSPKLPKCQPPPRESSGHSGRAPAIRHVWRLSLVARPGALPCRQACRADSSSGDRQVHALAVACRRPSTIRCVRETHRARGCCCFDCPGMVKRSLHCCRSSG